MHRSIGGFVLAIALAGCGLAGWIPGAVDPACRDRPDAADCQAALDVAFPALGSPGEEFRVTVDPVTCEADGCTTVVNAVPADPDACLPLGTVEMHRGLRGPWTVAMQSHGDPPCAFED